MSVNQRLKILVDTLENGKQSAFAKKIGVSPTVISSFMPGGRESKPSYEVLLKILEAYPQLRIEWMMTGEGEMESKGTPSSGNSGNKVSNSNYLGGDNTGQYTVGSNADLQSQLALALKENEGLKREVALLQQMVEMLQKK